MTFAERFAENVRFLHHDERIPISMDLWGGDGNSATLSLNDGILTVSSQGKTKQFSGSAEIQIAAALKEFGWEQIFTAILQKRELAPALP